MGKESAVRCYKTAMLSQSCGGQVDVVKVTHGPLSGTPDVAVFQSTVAAVRGDVFP